MNFVSLFAGVGGFDLAFERAGMDCVGQVEIDAKCREVLAKHWPDVPRFEDVHEVTAGDLYRTGSIGVGSESGVRYERDVGGRQPDALAGMDGGTSNRTGPVDVLCGGFPCQDYSVAGKRGGLAGDRGALWWQFHRLIDECRPRWVVGENVPGLLSSNNGRDFGAIVGSLVELGYGVVWRVLDAQYFGVAQRRRRVFIVGHSGGVPRPEILAFAEGCSGDTPPGRKSREEVAGTLGSRTGGTRTTDLDGNGAYIVGGLIATGFDWIRYGDSIEEQSPTIRVGSGLDIASPPAVAFHKMNAEAGWGEGLSTLRARDGKGDANLLAFSSKDHGADAGEQAPTLRSMNYDKSHVNGGGQVAIASESAVRRLTPLECERLQGFPDNWTAGQSDTQRYRQMGNAVAVPVAEWIGKQLAKAE